MSQEFPVVPAEAPVSNAPPTSTTATQWRSDLVIATVVEQPTRRSLLERFLDSFFHQDNIRWLALIGAAIVVASSLKLVTREWASWSVAAKYAVILSYTGLTYLLSDWGRKIFGLQITARVLQFLTLLLLPLTLHSLSWLFGPSESLTASGLSLLVYSLPAMVLCWYAASRIFDYLWGGRQTTFLVSYVALCAAGALPRFEHPGLAALVTLACWLIATVGTIKINRHVFWITEEHRYPRAFGFLPIALLGTLFLVLVGTKTALALPVEWLGFGLVLMAATILITTRTVADVVRQRSGGLLKTLPFNVMVPLLVGTALALLGVLVSFHGFSYGAVSTLAVVPTALVAAYLMLQTGWDTKKPTFVWIGLILIAIGYQCAPTLVSGLVQQIKATAAHAVGEQRLPIAFYGITYLPLLLSLAFAAGFAARAGQVAIARPMKHFTTLMSLLLLCVSWTHAKAACPIALLHVLVFGIYAIQFRDRRYAYAGLVSAAIAAGTSVLFVNATGLLVIGEEHAIAALAILASVLLLPTGLDRWIQSIPAGDEDACGDQNAPLQSKGCADRTVIRTAEPAAQLTGIVLTLMAALAWGGWIAWQVSQAYSRGWGVHWSEALLTVSVVEWAILVFNSLLIAALTRHYASGLAIWLLSSAGGLALMLTMHWPLLLIVQCVTFAAVTISLLVKLPVSKLRREPMLRSQLFLSDAKPNCPALMGVLLLPLYDLCVLVGLILSTMLYLPSITISNFAFEACEVPLGACLVFAWLLALRGLYGNRITGAVAVAVFPLLSVSLLLSFAWIEPQESVIPFIWACAAAVAGGTVVLLARLRRETSSSLSIDAARDSSDRSSGVRVSDWIGSESQPAVLWLMVATVLSFGSLSLMARMTALVALAAMLCLSRVRLSSANWTLWLVVANVQSLMCVAWLCGLDSWSMVWMLQSTPTAVPVLMTAIAASSAAWRYALLTSGLKADGDQSTGLMSLLSHFPQLDRPSSKAWRGLLDLAFRLGLAANFLLLETSEPWHTCWLIIALALAIVDAGMTSVRRQSVATLWAALAFTGAAIAWLVHQDYLVLGSGLSQAILMGLSIMAIAIARMVPDGHRLAYTRATAWQIGLTCPALVVGLSIVQTVAGQTSIPGFDALMVLLAAGIYYYFAVVTGRKRFFVLAAAALNIASIILWTSLSVHDLQFYFVPFGLTLIGLVEVLKAEMPSSVRTAGRYVGALTILVAPLFEIFAGSWLHLLSLLVLSVLVILLAIGLRLRPLVNTGTAFLLADLAGMVVHSAMDHPEYLWIGGLAVGVGVIALAAVCENQRERLLARIRLLSAELATWN